MADTDTKPECSTFTTRRYTVGYIRNSRTFTSFPSFTLKGNWMKTLGFESEQKIEELAELGQLIVRLSAER